MLRTRPSSLHTTDTAVVYILNKSNIDTTVVTRRVQDGRVGLCYGHDRRKMATHANQTTTTN